MSVLQDVRFATRSLRSRAAYAAISMLTIALVVGAGSAVFAVISATFVRPLPFADAKRLVWIYSQPPGTNGPDHANPLHSTEFVRFRQRLHAIADVAGIWSRERALDVSGEAEPVATGSISANYFTVLGVPTATGRMFTDREDLTDARVAVISHEFWRSRFGGKPAVGEKLVIDSEAYDVIGVLAPLANVGFVNADVYTPLHIFEGNMPLPAATLVTAVGRLAPGSSIEEATAEMVAVMRDVVKEAPATYTGWSAGAQSIRDALFGGTKPVLTLLFVAIGLLTAIACANLTNVTIAEMTGRRDEITLRTALGASRVDIVRLLAIEQVVIAGAGGLVGLLASSWLLPAVLALDANTAAQLGNAAVDWRVEIGALALATIVCVISGVLPALAGTRGDLARGLAQGGRRTAGSRRQIRVRAWLVGVETLVATVLLTASALLLSAFDRTAAIKPGFDADHVLSTQIRLPALAYPTADARATFVTRMLEEVRHVPGDVDASITNPLSAGGGYQTGLRIEAHPTADGQPHTVQFRRVSTHYFSTMRIPEIRGRTFTDADVATGQPVAVVSQRFAREFWPNEDSLGQRVVRTPDPTHPLTVVGIVGDANDAGLATPPGPTIYVAYAQNNSGAAPMTLVVRTIADPHDSVRAVTQALHRVDSTLPLTRTRTLAEFLAESLGPDRFRSVLLLAFASVGLALAAIGIYGVTSRGVTERTRELGVRLALGSGRAELCRLVLRQALTAVAIGLAVSVPVAWLALNLLAHWMPDLSTERVTTALPAVAIVAVAGLVAAALPAVRGARLDPVVALRAD